MKFRRKSIIVEANQFHPQGLPWPKGVIKINNNFMLPTLEGWAVVKSGDWIVDDDGNYYCCNPDTFEATYEAI